MVFAIVIAIDLVAIIGILVLARSKGGLERALPFATFMIAFVPIESLLPFGFFTLTTHRLVIGLLAVLCFTGRRATNEGSSKASLPLKTLIVIHILWSLLSTANSIVPVMSVKKLLSVLLEYYLLYWVYAKSITKQETIRGILTATVIALTVSSVWGIGETYQGWNIGQYLPHVSHNYDDSGSGMWDRSLRIKGTYPHPILYGAALAAAIVFALYLLGNCKKPSHKIFLWASLPLLALNLYKTSSRGPWLDAVLGCALLMLFGQAKLKRLTLYLAALVVLVCVVRPGIWLTISGLFENTFNPNTSTGSSYSYRYELQRAAVNRLQQEPLRAIWGFGPESFFDVRLEGLLFDEPHLFLSCDSAWVEFLVESGFVGLGIVVLLLAKPMWLAWRQYRQLPKEGRYLGLVFFAHLAMVYFQMFSVGMYAWGQNGYLLWIVIAMTAVNRNIHDRGGPKGVGRKIIRRVERDRVPAGAPGNDKVAWEPAGCAP